MNILFIGVACTDEAIKQSNKKYYNNNATVRPQQYFDLNLILGLSVHNNVLAISEPPVASYPRSNCLYYNRNEDVLSKNLKIKYIKLLNLFVIKTLMIMVTIFFETIIFCILNKKKESVILLGYLSFYISLPTMLIAKIFNIKIFVMVPDIPKYMDTYSNTKSIIRNKLSNLLSNLNKLFENNFDGYVLLTEYMNELVNLNKKPYIVMEGFVIKETVSTTDNAHKDPKNIVMYAGTLHEKYGIKKLIDAFQLINIDNCELWIYGEGDCLKLIQETSIINNSIKYKGTKNKDEIIKLEKMVTLLVNPRPSIEEFTKHSFPSKTLEYMASGTPVLTTKLLGIPDEYFEYLYTFDDESIEGLAKTILIVLSKSKDELYEKGKAAKEFVLMNKNNMTQTERILNMITRGTCKTH